MANQLQVDRVKKFQSKNFPVIELHQLNLNYFYPLSAIGSFTIHTSLFPLTLVRTRLQLQEGKQLYRGLWHCMRTVVAEEGLRGLYAGFWVKGFQIVSSLFYVGTYEGVRQYLGSEPASIYAPSVFCSGNTLSPAFRSFVAGGCASLVGQTLTNPVDVISQHVMVLANRGSGASKMLTPLKLSDAELKSSFRRAITVIQMVKKEYGFRGFYHGYFMSLCTFVPNSALWWMFYNSYCDMIDSYIAATSVEIPRLTVQLSAATAAGVSSAVVINPVDIIRVRMQVENTGFIATMVRLLKEEGILFGRKGLTARMAQSCMLSFWFILFYEPVKVYCLKPEFSGVIFP